MSKISRWLRNRALDLSLALFGKYWTLLFTRWQALLWGGGVLAVGWGLYFILGSPPVWINLVAVIASVVTQNRPMMVT
jgi:hypothetical protein